MPEELIQINIKNVLASRAPGIYRYIPDFVLTGLERLIKQDEMNVILQETRGMTGATFCQGVLKHLDITYKINGLENLPSSNDPASWRVLFVCNHPLGGLDGMTLIKFLTELSPEKDMRFIVNDLLMHIEPLQNVFLPVNTVSRKQSKQGARDIDAVMRGNLPVAIFPAGLCSRLVKGHITDLTWNKMFINKARQYERNIIPLYFEGKNSGFFYKFAKLRKMLRIPINLEMALLPREVFRNKGSQFTISIGKAIPWETLRGGMEAIKEAERIKSTVYALGKHT